MLCLLLILTAGCASDVTGDDPSAVQSLHLFSVPVAVNLDKAPGPDGFAVRLFARGSNSAKGIAIPNGTLEIVMFDGFLPEAPAPTVKPLRSWNFTGRELDKRAGQSAVGVGYRFTLRWADSPPSKDRITILARHTPRSGTTISSAPSTISVTPSQSTGKN